MPYDLKSLARRIAIYRATGRQPGLATMGALWEALIEERALRVELEGKLSDLREYTQCEAQERDNRTGGDARPGPGDSPRD